MDPTSLTERAMRQWRITVTVVAVCVVAGVYSFFTMQRQEFPAFTIRQGLVIGVMPGATSEEVEDQLARPVEDFLFSFNEVNKAKTYSVSKDGQLVVFVEVKEDLDGIQTAAFWAKLRHGLNELKAQKLPGGVLALVGNNEFGDTSALLFTLVAEGKSPRDLREYMKVLESHLRRIEATAKLRVIGEQDEVISINISRDRVARYGIRPATLWASLQGLGALPVYARLDGDELERPIYVRKVLRSENELAETILLSLPTGQHVRLKDVAEIKREYGHDDAYVRFNGKTALVLSIEMQPGNDITRFGDEVDRALEETLHELPPGVTISRVVDQPKVVRTSVNHFLRDFGLAIASVILVTMLLLPVRVAAVAAITIPVSIAITLAILNALGGELQTVSLAGLIVVLGMIVDNAIVVIDDHVDKLDRGMDAWSAAWMSAHDLAVPVFTATIAIILSYVPMPRFLTGVAAEFLGSLPVTIAVALSVSLLIALLLLPIMNSQFVRRGLRKRSGQRSMLERIQCVFDRALDAVFRHPWLTVAGGIGSVLIAVVIALRIPQQMFPKVDRDQFAVEVYLPTGRSLKQTDAVMRRLEAELLADKRVVNVTSFVGQSAPRFHTLYAPYIPRRNFGQLLVNTIDADATLDVLRESEERLRGAFPECWVRWKQLEFQVGFPVEVRLSGNDAEALKTTGAKIESYARGIAEVTWVHNDWEEALQSVDVMPDADACARLGVPPAMLQASLALGTQAYRVGTIWEGDYPVRVLVRDDSGERGSVEGLRQQYVSSILGATVPLEQIASLRPAWHEGAMVRRNGVRTLTVFIDIKKDALASEMQEKIEKYVSGLDLPGIRVSYGGEKELSTQIFSPMTISMLVSIGLIFLVVLCQFQRFLTTLVVMLSMPLTLMGAFLGLVIMGYPFGFTAFVGIIGLMGIAVRNGIILVTYAEELRVKQGLSAMEAARAAGKRRMRPIYLTSTAAAVGVVPMILSRSTLWGPLGTVTFFGLLTAMVLTLFVLPVTYALVVGREDRRHEPSPKAPVVTGLLLGLALAVSPASADETPLTLQECKELALQNNAQIRESNLEIEAARETRRAAYTKYFPQISVSATGAVAVDPLARIHTSGGNLPVYNGNPATIPTATQFAYFPSGEMAIAGRGFVASAAVIQPLFAGGRIVSGNRLADLGVHVAKDRAEISKRDVLAQTEEKYWRLVALREKLRTLDAYEALLEALDRQVTDAVQAGLLTRNDQLKVRLKRSEASVDRQRLENGVALATRDLRRHIGLPEGGALRLVDTLACPDDPSILAQERAGALDRRPEIRLLSRAIRAEQLQNSLTRGGMLPTVSVGAIGLRQDIRGMISQTNGLLMGMVNVPISGLWEGRHTTASQHRRVEIAENRLAETRELLDLQIESAWTDLTAAWRSNEVANEAVDQADVNLAEVSDRYRNGLVTFSDLLEAQVLRQKATDSRIDARADYWLKRAAYLRAVAAADGSE